ncbi:MAG: endolytic transglycosylase MltG [Actinomycetota bacterium]
MRLTPRGKVVVVFLIVAALLGAPALAGMLYLRSIGVFGGSDPGEKVEVEIPEGASIERVGELLEERDVVRSGFGVRVAAYLRSGEEVIQAGTYELRTGLSARDALDELLEGPVLEFVNVTFPEGSWLTDFARILERDTHIAADAFLRVVGTGEIRSRYRPDDVDTLEGLLFPSTYQVVEEDTAATVATRLVDEFEKRVGQLDLSKVELLGVTPYQAIIVASMVEAEARVPSERAKIAAVIYNRLEQGIRLGIDATVLYALGEHKEVLTRSDLAVDSPYNTRLFPGLPPTPIGAAGIEALRAAADPADGDWLYYVLADCEGHHAFSVGYDEFLQNKATYQALEC